MGVVYFLGSSTMRADAMVLDLREDTTEIFCGALKAGDDAAVQKYLDGKDAAVREFGEVQVQAHLDCHLYTTIDGELVDPDLSIIRLLLDAGASGGCFGPPLLNVPCYTFDQSPAVASLLVDRGADVNVRDGNGRTSLMRCCPAPDTRESAIPYCWSKALDMVRVLLARGADAALVDNEGHNAEDLHRSGMRATPMMFASPSAVLSFQRIEKLLVFVRLAGGASAYLKAPRVELARLRLLVARGRAQPPPFASPKNVAVLARLFSCAPQGKRFRPLPKEIFWHVLTYWRTTRDDELDYTAEWPGGPEQENAGF